MFSALDMPFNITMDWRVERRQSSPEDKGYSEGTHTIHLPALEKGERNPVRQDLQKVNAYLIFLLYFCVDKDNSIRCILIFFMLQVLEAAISVTSPSIGNLSTQSIPVVIPNLLPKLIKVNSNGANPILQLLPGKSMKTAIMLFYFCLSFTLSNKF